MQEDVPWKLDELPSQKTYVQLCEMWQSYTPALCSRN